MALRTSLNFVFFFFSIFLFLACQDEAPPAARIPTRSEGTQVRRPTKCVKIYYDQSVEKNALGRAEAIFLENLIGHFSHIQQFLSPIEAYQKGDLEKPLDDVGKCQATFYVGSYYDNPIPQAFLDDFYSTKDTVVWIGDNIWQMPAKDLKRLWNVRFDDIVAADKDLPDENGIPGFYRRFNYKGETFVKSVDVDKKTETITAADEIVAMRPIDKSTNAYVKSWAEHSGVAKEGKKIPRPLPYVLNHDNHWYIADLPFEYIHRADRYLIVADLLFDILQEAPLYTGPRPAFVRFEDLHAKIPKWELEALTNLAKKEKLNFAMSVIPEFVDVRPGTPGGEIRMKATESQEFMDWMDDAQKNGGSLLMHGWTHQADRLPNPMGISGWDYEFWTFSTNGPLANDSLLNTLDRLEKGYKILDEAGFRPYAWLTPHYAASALDNFVFGQVFEWSIGGVQVAPFKVVGDTVPDKLTFDVAGVAGAEARRKILSAIKFKYLKTGMDDGFSGPYEVYGDVYNQGLLPETAGYLNPVADSPEKNYVDDMLRVMKRNRVIRDAWGSFFIHPYMLNEANGGGIAKFPGDTSELERLINGTRKLGYEFIDLKEWLKVHGKFKRKPSLER